MSILSRRSDVLPTMSKVVGVISVLNNHDEPALVLRSSDGPMFPVDEASAMESGYLKFFIESRQYGKVYTEVPSHILEKIVYFIRKRTRENFTKDLEFEFVQQNQHLLLDVLEAAFDLHIESLLDLARKVVLDMIAEHTCEEFCEIFNLSVQEMSEMPKYEVWAFKQSCKPENKKNKKSSRKKNRNKM